MQTKFESSRRHVDAVSENERKRSLSLQIDQTENLANTSEAKYEPSRSRVDAVSENERKRSLNLQIDQTENLTNTSVSEV